MNQSNFTLYKRISLLIIIAVVILISIFSYYLYGIERSRNASFEKSSEMVLKETEMVTITEMYTYQEKELFHIFLGEDDVGKELISVLHFKNNKEISSKNIKTYQNSKFISENAILDKWAQTCNKCEMIKIQPALIDEKLLWEITYNDVGNRYVFDYYLMTDGKQYEELKLKRIFN